MTKDEPVAYFNPQGGFYWAKPTTVTAPVTIDVEPLPLYTTPQLKQKQGEPVAWLHTKIKGLVIPHRPADLNKHPNRWEALYKTTPQQGCDECGVGGGYALYCLVCSEKFFGKGKEWVGLTDYEIKGVLGLSESWVGEDCSIPDMIGFAKAIEAKLKDKNHVVSGQ